MQRNHLFAIRVFNLYISKLKGTCRFCDLLHYLVANVLSFLDTLLQIRRLILVQIVRLLMELMIDDLGLEKRAFID